MDPKGGDYKLASSYISSFKDLGPNARKAHNPREEGIIHYFVKKNLSLSVIKQMAYIIDSKYEGALLEDLETVNTEEEDVFMEIDKKEGKEKEGLLNLFQDLADYMNTSRDFEFV